MKIYVVGFTKRGLQLGVQLGELLRAEDHEVSVYGKKTLGVDGVLELVGTLDAWVREAFSKGDALLFIGATGIAVRTIAPYLKDKFTDPGVVVVDEMGMYSISLLSGHCGGANDLARKIARLIGAVPVVTTATDIHHKLAVDEFAKKNNLFLKSPQLAKKIGARIVAGESVGFYTDGLVDGEVPEELRGENRGLGVAVTLNTYSPYFKETLYLVPRVVTLGIGCRKGVKKEVIHQLVSEILENLQISIQGIERIASIDIKEEEQGLMELSEMYGVPLMVYSKEALLEVEGDFTSSEFVETITGVSNVCERSAVRGAGGGMLVQKKIARQGVTVAVAIREWRIHFE